MRRISLALALICAVAAAGCSGGSKRSADAGGSPGISDGKFKVTVQNTAPLDIKGGTVTSDVQPGINCGAGIAAADQRCEASFPLGSTVVLTASANGLPSTDKDANGVALPYKFFGWAGDCSGEGTCSLSGNSDKYVVATFAGKRTGHPNWTAGSIHGPEYNKFVAQTPGYLDCKSCHGASLQGIGIAVACTGCHPSMAPPVPPAAKPTLVFTQAPTTGTAQTAANLGALATDPGGATVTCTWSLASKPTDSAASLTTSGTCSGAPGTASFTPDVAGIYVVRVVPSNGAGTLEATIAVAAQQFGGGVASVGTDTADAALIEIANRLHAVLKKGYNNVAPADLAKSLAGLDNSKPRNFYAIVDVRLPEDFARGHIPGAVNVPLASLPDVLLANPYFPEASSYTKRIIVAGYNAGDSTMGAVVFNSARWVGDNATGDSGGAGAAARPAWALKYGMSSWTYDRSASPTRFDDDVNVRRYQAGAIETAASVPLSPLYAFTALGEFTGNPNLTQKILVRSRAFLQSLMQEAADNGIAANEAMWTTFVELNKLRSDGDPSNDPQMVDVRGAANYTTGHVPGAIFIPYQQVARLVATNEVIASNVGGAAVTPTQPTTRLLDPSKKIFVQCVTGHTGGHATMALGILGYKARNVLYGMNGWTESSAYGGGGMVGFDFAADSGDFPMVSNTDCNLLAGMTGAAPAVLDPTATSFNSTACQTAYAIPPRAGCTSCHGNFFALFSDVLLTPLPVTTAVASEGEG